MKKILFILLLINSLQIDSQNPISFNKQFTEPSWYGGTSSAVYINNNSYVLFGHSDYWSNLGSYFAISSVFTDINGNYLNDRIIYHPSNHAVYYNNFEKVNSNFVLLSGFSTYSFSPSFLYYPTLVKCNIYTGDTTWFKQYHQLGDSAELYTSVILSDSSIISFGVKNLSAIHNTFIMKVDKKGNYKWHKWINTGSDTISIRKVVKKNDNN